MQGLHRLQKGGGVGEENLKGQQALQGSLKVA